MNATTPDLAKLEENISTAKVDDKDSNWFSNFFSGIVDLGKSLFGLNTDENGGSDNLEAKDYNLAAVDASGVYIEDLNNDFKTLSAKLSALKSLRNKLKTDSGDENLANKLAVAYFESSSLFTFLSQFDEFRKAYKIITIEYDYLYSVGNSNYLPSTITKYSTEWPSTSSEDMKAVGGTWNADLGDTTKISDKKVLENAKSKWEVLSKIKAKTYTEPLFTELNRNDFTDADTPYHLQKVEGSPDDSGDINIIGLFEDQLNLFRINGTVKDISKVTVPNSKKSKNNKDDYSSLIDAFYQNSGSGSGSFSNNFFNYVIICNHSLIKKLKNCGSRKDVIEYLMQYIQNNLVEDAAINMKFHNPEQLAKDDLRKHWEKLGNPGYDIDTKIEAWGSGCRYFARCI